jgi:hypothetical protein
MDLLGSILGTMTGPPKASAQVKVLFQSKWVECFPLEFIEAAIIVF